MDFSAFVKQDISAFLCKEKKKKAVDDNFKKSHAVLRNNIFQP